MAASLSTENYDRLTKVARLDYSDEDASLLNDLKAQLASLKTACASFSGNTGVEGATHAAMTSKVSDFEASIANLEGRVETVETAHTQARQAMQEAKSVQGTLSTQLLHPSDQAAAQVIAQGQPNEAAIQNEYIQNMMAQRNAQREAQAKAALDAMNGQVTSAAAGFSGDSSNGDGDSNGGGGSSSGDAGVAGAGSHGGAQYAAGGSAGVGSAGSGAPIAGLEVLPSVSPSSSVLAGVDVTTMPVGGYMTPDGPAGGHIPAPVTDADDPRWKPDYNPFSTSSHSKDLAIAGGALTTGGTLAGLGRMATSATSIAGSMGGFASRAATSQFGTVPAGGALAPSTSARLSSSNAISSAMNDLERGALTPRGTAQAGNWGNAARMANPGTPASTAARAGGFPRGMGAPGAYGSGATAGTGAGTSSTASNTSTMSARARAAASIRPTGVSGTTATGAPANGAAAGARGTASSAAKGPASVKAGTGSQSAAASARSASASAARTGVGARPGVMGTTAGSAPGSSSTAKGSATKGTSASPKAASSAKTSSAGTGAARGASSNGNVSGGASSAAARGASAAAARGPIGAGAVAGAASKEEKDKAKRRALSGLKAVRVEGVEEKAPAAAGLSAGNAESLKPVAVADQDDRW